MGFAGEVGQVITDERYPQSVTGPIIQVMPWWGWLLYGLVCAAVCGWLAHRKHLSVGENAGIGAFLGIIGVFVVALRKDAPMEDTR